MFRGSLRDVGGEQMVWDRVLLDFLSSWCIAVLLHGCFLASRLRVLARTVVAGESATIRRD